MVVALWTVVFPLLLMKKMMLKTHWLSLTMLLSLFLQEQQEEQ